ncbi:hypothetical protein [Paraburkholderia sp.]|uniref:hypothetical protein n=1 Tax=Paraburkholderia sp. TaxID=1926495 RepID=UPI0039E71F32
MSEAFRLEQAKGAEKLLEGMSPDVRKLVEFDAKFRLGSVIRQAAQKKAVINTFANMLRAHADSKQAFEEIRPEWGSW